MRTLYSGDRENRAEFEAVLEGQTRYVENRYATASFTATDIAFHLSTRLIDSNRRHRQLGAGVSGIRPTSWVLGRVRIWKIVDIYIYIYIYIYISHINIYSSRYDLKVCDDGTLVQILCFWKLSISCLYLQCHHNVSKTEFCLRLQVKPTQLGPIDRASPYLRTIWTLC
jgi:hypothetical protein